MSTVGRVGARGCDQVAAHGSARESYRVSSNVRLELEENGANRKCAIVPGLLQKLRKLDPITFRCNKVPPIYRADTSLFVHLLSFWA